jgi:pilus assembly protein CpaE
MNCIIIDGDSTNRQELAGFLVRHGVTVTHQLSTADTLAAVLGRGEPPQLVVMNLDPGAHENLRRVGQLPRQHGATTSFFVMSQLVDANLLIEAMHLGVTEFIPLPMSEEKLAAAIDRVSHKHGMGRRAKLINVVPSIGGCGSTTIACNVAAKLAGVGRTALVDMDLMRGGVAGYFDLRPRYNIADVMDSADKVDKQLLDNALTVHKATQLAILARPEMPEDTQRVNQAGLHRLLTVLSRMFDYVVVDSIMSISPLYAHLLRTADLNVVAMQLNVPSAKNAERFVGALRRMAVESSRIRIVVNRYIKRGSDIEPEEVERALGLKIAWLVPNDFKNAIGAINFGEPVVLRSPRSEMSKSLSELAATLAPRAVAGTRAA